MWIAGFVVDLVAPTESGLLMVVGWIVAFPLIGLTGISFIFGGLFYIVKSLFWPWLNVLNPAGED